MDDLWQSCDDSAFNFLTAEQSNSNFLVPPPSPSSAPPEPASLAADEASMNVAASDTAGIAAEAPVAAAEDGATLAEQPAAPGEDVTERDKILCLLSHFDRDQLDRYEAFRRGAFPKSVIRMIMQNVSGRPVTQNAVIAMAGITKVYVGEIVEEALRFREQQLASSGGASSSSSSLRKTKEEDNYDEKGATSNGHDGKKSKEPTEPLKPSHVYEAVRRLSSKMVYSKPPVLRL